MDFSYPSISFYEIGIETMRQLVQKQFEEASGDFVTGLEMRFSFFYDWSIFNEMSDRLSGVKGQVL